jgi:hypothetical protein
LTFVRAESENSVSGKNVRTIETVKQTWLFVCNNTQRIKEVKEKMGKFGVAILLILVIAAVALPSYVYNSTKATFTDTVTKAWVKSAPGSTDQKYLIETTNHGVLEDTDNYLYLKFDSSDIYGQLQPGHTYTFTTVGWRIPLLSWYPDVLSVQEVS